MVLSIHSSIKKGFRRLSGSPRKRPNRSTIGNSSSDQRDSKSNVKVVVRVRPQNKHEEETGKETIIKVLDDNVLVFDPKEENNDFYFHGKKQKGRDLLRKPKKDLKLAFDRVFDGEATNEEVFKDTTDSVVDGLLNGYNCSVFAYGATGAGKTFTMLGNAENPGITFLTVMELYNRIESIKSDKTCDIAVSYLEVYNESIRDLLMPSQCLALREDPQRGVIVSGLTLHKPKNAQDLLSMLQFGNKNRTQHPTDANAESSRSHAVFIVYVKQQDRSAGLQANVKVAKMVLIDLAGSERATVTRNSGARMREGANINKSLLALGNCINSLADKRTKSQHVPYRDSKLTRLLKDSLGGNCQTVMIAAVSSSSLTYEDTYNTLRYADRAKNIKAHLKKNVMSVDMHVTKYVKIVEELKKRIVELEEQLSRQPVVEKVVEPVSSDSALSISNPVSIKLQGQLQKVFTERQSTLNELLNFEIMDRHLDVRLSWRQTIVDRLNVLSVDNFKVEKSTQKADHAIKLMERKRNRILIKKPEIMGRLDENTKLVEEVKSEIASTNEVTVRRELEHFQMEIELLSEKKNVQHLQQVVKMQDAEAAKSELILQQALKLVRQQHLILSGHGYLTSDLKDDFNDIYKQVERCKEVAWADQEDTRIQKANKIDVHKLINLPINNICGNDDCHSVFNDDNSKLPFVSKSLSTVNSMSSFPTSDQNIDNISEAQTPFPHSHNTLDHAIETILEQKTLLKNNFVKNDLAIESSKELNFCIKPSGKIHDVISEKSTLPSGNELSDDVFVERSPKEGCFINKKAMKRSLSIESPALSAASREVIRGIKKLGLDSTCKVNPVHSKTMAVSANILFEPPTINDNVKKCLNSQFSSLESVRTLNETFEQSFSSISPLNETFEKIAGSDSTSTSVELCDKFTANNNFSRLNSTFSDEKIPVKVSANSTFNFKTPSQSPLSTSSQNLSKSSLKSLTKSTEFKAKKSARKLNRTQSISGLKSENGENRRMKRFSSARSIPAAMTKTALLRNILSKANSVSSLRSGDTFKKMMNEKKNSTAFR